MEVISEQTRSLDEQLSHSSFVLSSSAGRPWLGCPIGQPQQGQALTAALALQGTNILTMLMLILKLLYYFHWLSNH